MNIHVHIGNQMWRKCFIIMGCHYLNGCCIVVIRNINGTIHSTTEMHNYNLVGLINLRVCELEMIGLRIYQLYLHTYTSVKTIIRWNCQHMCCLFECLNLLAMLRCYGWKHTSDQNHNDANWLHVYKVGPTVDLVPRNSANSMQGRSLIRYEYVVLPVQKILFWK